MCALRALGCEMDIYGGSLMLMLVQMLVRTKMGVDCKFWEILG